MKKPIFVVNVDLDECSVIKGMKEQVNFLRFHGTSESEFFCGDILTGGVDCQRQTENEPLQLSARYVMEGTDCTGSKCKVFIENNGYQTSDGMRTLPTIITDSEILSGLTRRTLYGEISGKGDNSVEIRIYEETGSFRRENFYIEHGEKNIYGELYRPNESKNCPVLIMSHGFNQT